MVVQKCRICLDIGTFDNIFRVNGSLMISTQIMSLANISIFPGDGLPSTICLICTNRLENCIDFVEQCERSDLHLRSKCIETVSVDSSNDDDKGTIKVIEENRNTFSSEEINKHCLKKGLVHDLSLNHQLNDGTKPFENVSTKSGKGVLTNNLDNLVSKKSHKQQCFTCGKVMSSRFRLKTHLRTHTGERPYSCPHCSKNFSLAQNLKVHLRIHTGEKPFRCMVCGEAFAHSAGLAVHKRKHTGQKPYQCILCPRTFRTAGHLQYHVRKHTGAKNFECHTCGRAFITRSDLKQHLVTHSGEKTHVCCICGMRMTRASHLKRHILFIHSNDKRTQSENFSKLEENQKNEISKEKVVILKVLEN